MTEGKSLEHTAVCKGRAFYSNFVKELMLQLLPHELPLHEHSLVNLGEQFKSCLLMQCVT